MMDGRVAVVTGAGSGIGRAVALALLGDGYVVALAGRRAEPLEETASLAMAGIPLIVPTDVTDPASVDALFAELEAKAGRLDVLFNNAGVGAPTTNFGDVTFEQWQAVISVNINGMFLCANRAYRMMRDQTPRGGRIINNGSISAHTPRPGSAPYTASKHAVTGLTKSISLDGRIHNIVASQIDIGNAATDMTTRMAKGVPQADGTIAVEPTMDVATVGATVLNMAKMSLDANVQFITIMASSMPFIGRG
ncbi:MULTISPECIES: SDR family oxidoreductase [unclassified Rhizobium]|uniref:SDR family oxidoreductase n=2 Tax=unclassified Rhizobium TaxID=2613769 RepID=UPI00192A1C07|nr:MULTISPECIES: SDR family oxidoreductase [unclassified Rhizobium]MBO9101618.1 SDR family oxidoreductase [Rhizobium sp. L58/93]MBO9134721.1 SDR family oxidoreductase [Rhizobium sp. B209b/85]MBO9170598.1 SDR family oxidoreductase [Rhizobium sp. L245/93]MBO9187611.1 SDR family oxidoreductase [Rhizobium sp. E27B/91]MBZ5761272.1 SDR family oxidoreductase [Rhizobium sp. VS19-DR96]